MTDTILDEALRVPEGDRFNFLAERAEELGVRYFSDEGSDEGRQVNYDDFINLLRAAPPAPMTDWLIPLDVVTDVREVTVVRYADRYFALDFIPWDGTDEGPANTADLTTLRRVEPAEVDAMLTTVEHYLTKIRRALLD